MPIQAMDAAAAALSAHFGICPVLSLSVVRDGFSQTGEVIGPGMPGVADLAEELRNHGIAEIDFINGCDAQSLLAFLEIVVKTPEEVRAAGGFSASLATAGVECIRATDVALTVIEQVDVQDEQDVDVFLRMLASDPDKLSTWMAAAASGDPAAFEEGLSELASAVGEHGMPRLLSTLAEAFKNQNVDGKDALLGLALENGPARRLTSGMFDHLENTEIASSVADGVFGKNMLSLSNALSHLPIQNRIGQVYDRVQAMFAEGSHSEKELHFLQHMMETHKQSEPETSLIDADSSYLSVAAAAAVADDEIARMRGAAQATSTSGSSVTTMLALLDQQHDFDLYCRTVDNLSRLVPKLLDNGDLDSALRVITGLTARESRTSQPWPDLADRLRNAVRNAVSPASMRSLLQTVMEDETRSDKAREIMRAAGEAAGPSLVVEALRLKQAGLEIAEKLIGRRIVDLLTTVAPDAQWFEVAPLVGRLALEPDGNSVRTVNAIISRSDAQSRREAAQGLAAAGTTASVHLLATMLGDTSAEVSIVATRALARCDSPEVAGLLAAHLAGLDMDGKDFPTAREIIGVLARIKSPDARDALQKLASRKALIKRGHFSDIQELARQALAKQAQKGGDR
ncbi:MAG: HEAT repeat domain-containing protein [Actinomycetota bacterium]|nr:HEAT repeat domain-containing protein [Actinomycetota bacterium]